MASDIDPQEIIDGLERLGSGSVRHLQLDDRRFLAEAAEYVRDLVEQLAEYDAAPVTDARIWDGVRDRVNAYLCDQRGDVSTAERLALMIVANQVTTIALGEREEP